MAKSFAHADRVSLVLSFLLYFLTHGSYHTPAPYESLFDAFESKGFDAYCPQLPTSDLTKLDVGDINKPDFDRHACIQLLDECRLEPSPDLQEHTY